MEDNKQYNMQDFESCVSRYVTKKLGYIFDEKNDGNLPVLVMKGKRNKRIVIISQHKFLNIHIEKLQDVIDGILESEQPVSDTIDVFWNQAAAPSLVNKIEELGNKNQVSYKVYDLNFMKQQAEFQPLFDDYDDNHEEQDNSCALYEYLSMGNDSSFIKNSLNYSLILFAIYDSPNIVKRELAIKMKEKYDCSVSLENDISYLRAKGKIKPASAMPNKDTLDLTEEERKRITESVDEFNEAEKSFVHNFFTIMKRYGIEDGVNLLNELKELYQKYYNWNLDENHSNTTGTSERTEKALDDFKSHINEVVKDESKTDDLIAEVKGLCSESPYLNRIALSNSFIGLYKSDKYKDYINDRKNFVFLDTPVFVYFVIAKSEINERYPNVFDDRLYDVVKELTDYKERQNNINFFIPYDYIGETVGEYQKALRLSVFDRMKGFPISIQTANTFFSYYQALKEMKSMNGEDTKEYWFEDFADEFMFPTTDTSNTKFQYEMSTYFSQYAEKLGCTPIGYITKRFKDFDEVKKDYEMKLNRKTEMAVKNDVRQSLYITEESAKPENMIVDYYLATYDNTLSKLRDIVKEATRMPRSYSVKRPEQLINALRLKRFDINPENVTNDIFAYADKSYSLSSKIRSLFDNVLTPYFSGCAKHNSALVNSLAKMQQQLLDNNDSLNSDPRFPLEDIFLSIEKALTRNSCTIQDLSKYLCAEENNGFVTDLFSKAFDSYITRTPIDISEKICDEVKKMLALMDEENMKGVREDRYVDSI